MRERITFIQKQGDSLEPSALKVTSGSIEGPDVQAVREDRLTLALEELPAELRNLLKDIHELHIRWVSPEPYEAVSPLLARLPAGFHLFYTPGEGSDDKSDHLCKGLSKVFGIYDCSSPAESFTSLPSDRFSHSTAFQFFKDLPEISSFVKYVKDELCPASDASCAASADALAQASTLDISYDTISHSLKATALWPYQSRKLQATSRPRSRTEVGLLSTDPHVPNLEPQELGVSGLLTVLGQDDEPKPTMFSFASRHRDAESSFYTRALQPAGLHPVLQLRLESSEPPAAATKDEGVYCAPHAYFALPKTIFVDKYQLSDDLFLASKNLTALRYISQPVDLEAPEYVMTTWGSSVLLELSPPGSGDKSQPWTAEVPLHLRYISPGSGGYSSVGIPYPAVFWACTSEDGTRFPNNPFEKVNLGYDGLFGPRTVFWHVEPRPQEGTSLLRTKVDVPVLDLDKARWVNVGTAAAVLLGFAWVAWKLFAAATSSSNGAKKDAQKAKKQQ